MKSQFINNQLIISLGASSVFVAFIATLGTLYFRQEAFIHANNLMKIEAQCAELENENLILSARIAQIQAPCYLKEKNFALALQIPKEQILRVQHWNEYKELFLVHNALAMNTPLTYKFSHQ
ncbi:MAG: hypothetical protein LBB05_04470 [Puniceicoccales bacterium]|jgi:hypothetical protein|nr:hypothetical protein [Puniceicoccales bacterium]